MQVKYLKPILVTSALIGLSQWSGLSFAQTADQLYKRGLAATCANCHGTDGTGVVDAQALAQEHLRPVQEAL